MRNIIFVTVFGLLFSCSSLENKNVNDNSAKAINPDQESKDGTISGCYQMVIERDTAEMKLDVRGDSARGDLFYNPFETDSNFGRFAGTYKDSTIRAWYTFESEGMISYREVVYKLTEEGFVEGYGDIEMSNDSAWFKYPQALKFEDDHPFKKIVCK